VVPKAIEAFAGDKAMEDNAAALTVSVVEPEMAPDIAVMVVCPVLTLVASPLVPAVLLMVATAKVFDVQVTVPVMFCVLPSVYDPVAVNCLVLPKGIVGIAGVTVIESNAAGVTVNVVEPLIGPELAVIVVCPVATLAASPILGAVLLTVATAGTELFQVTEPVRLRVLPSV
jgi:hypothetical protein